MKDRLDPCRAWMQALGYDALIVPTNDPHFSEYVADHWGCRQWLSGFSGSAGTAVVTADKAIVSVDSRYFLQAEEQLADGFEILKQQKAHAAEHLDWLGEQLEPGAVVVLDGRLCSVEGFEKISDTLAAFGLDFQACEDPFAQLWAQRPSLPGSQVFELDITYSGRSRADKLTALRDELEGGRFLVAALDEISWLLNLRGADVQYNPVVYAWLLVGPDSAVLCCDNPMPQEVRQGLAADGVEMRPYDAVSALVAEQDGPLQADLGQLPVPLGEAGDFAHSVSPLALHKAIKNDTEIANLRRAMVKDAVALAQFYRWLDAESGQRPVSEWECARYIDECRGLQAHCLGPSFGTIVAHRGNAAGAHYEPQADEPVILEEGILLIDSGGQYLEGTTDITRTIYLGEPGPEHVLHYTLILQGLIALSQVEFPVGTTGGQLDVLARLPLWQEGLNYGHGTGHGVGYLLNVHEGPQGFGSGATAKNAALQPGMLITIEPGYYLPGSHGIRTENMVVVAPAEREGFLKFDTLTVYPIDTQMVDYQRLTEAERDWLEAFNADCRKIIATAAEE
ncbi:MAG: M24 family metallopeptidase [Candidatus Latescibacteria bacterium]|nr:M24 family metallopeptidase [Candidatus Latescibacterota bacterium]